MIRQIAPGKARAKFNETMWDSNNFVGEKKYDGSRALMHCGLGGNRFTSRHISVKTKQFTEKTENFPHLKNIFSQNGLDVVFEGCVFDGELVFGKNSMDVTKITGSLPEKAIQFQTENGWLNFVTFDILFDKGKDIRDKPYSYRRGVLEGYLGDLNLEYLEVTPIIKSGKKDFYEEVLESGGEGIILKDTRAKYGDGWSKVKRSAQWDVIISGFKDPKEITKKTSGEESASKYYEKGWIGAISFGQYLPNGQFAEFGFCSGIDEALREKISNNKEFYIGKVIEITAQERLTSGHFRHPRFLRFRPDKNAESCVYRIGEV